MMIKGNEESEEGSMFLFALLKRDEERSTFWNDCRRPVMIGRAAINLYSK